MTLIYILSGFTVLSQGEYSIYGGTPIEGKTLTLTFTKDVVVGFSPVDFDIPTQLWNFVGSQPGHSNCIVESLCGLGECNTFAEILTFSLKSALTIYCGIHPKEKAPSWKLGAPLV